MSRIRRNNDWGFPRWREYGSEKEATTVRLCDHQGCGLKGDFPAPKSPHKPEKWYFCEEHVTEYNKGWDYFAGMSDDEAMEHAKAEARTARGYRSASTWEYSDAQADGLTPSERSAFRALDLPTSATGDEIKTTFRTLAKQLHPDKNPGDAVALARFQAASRAYEVLKGRT